jgi:hypothetical protein
MTKNYWRIGIKYLGGKKIMNANTYKNWLLRVKANGTELKYVPVKYKTAELCLAAVQQDCWTLGYVPEELKTAELCLAAVQQHTTSEAIHTSKKVNTKRPLLTMPRRCDLSRTINSCAKPTKKPWL